MGEATLEHTMRTLAATVVGDTPFAVTLHRVAELAMQVGLPVAAVEVQLVDARGRPLEEVRAGGPTPAGDGLAERLTFSLEVSGHHLGTISLFPEASSPFSDDHASVAEEFAAQAAAVLANARAYWDLHELASGLQAAMQSRAVIEQAKGKLMALEHCTADEAFTMLARASQRENVKLRELARRVVEGDGRI